MIPIQSRKSDNFLVIHPFYALLSLCLRDIKIGGSATACICTAWKRRIDRNVPSQASSCLWSTQTRIVSGHSVSTKAHASFYSSFIFYTHFRTYATNCRFALIAETFVRGLDNYVFPFVLIRVSCADPKRLRLHWPPIHRTLGILPPLLLLYT